MSDRPRPRPCPCGSGIFSHWQFDARGIELCRTCPKCHDAKMAQYRPDVLSDPNYETTEDVEPDQTHEEAADVLAKQLGVPRGWITVKQPIESGEEGPGTVAMKKAYAELLLAGMGKTDTIYQGVNRLCARCGQPITDGGVASDNGRMLFYYCSTACKEAH